MDALDRNLGLIRPGAADLALAANQDCARLGVNKQFVHIALGEPLPVRLYDGNDIRRFALYRNLAGPR